MAGLALALGSGCAAPGSDLHLAPVYTRASAPGGATVHEAAGGLIHGRRDPSGDRWQSFAVRPFLGWRRGWTDPTDAPEPPRDWHPRSADDLRVDFLAPLGFWKSDADEIRSMLAPVYYWRSADSIRTGEREFDLLSLPLIYLARNDWGGNKTAWFPFFGVLDKFLTYDRVRFALFPLYLSASREKFTHHNVLFPFLGWAANHEGGEPARKHLRLWPLFTYHEKPGDWRRVTLLWPFLHHHRNFMSRPEEQQESIWAFLPLFGWTKLGSYRSVSFLWPFFGYAWDPRGAEAAEGQEDGEAPGAYWAWDGPWPFVRVQSGGRDPRAAVRQRFWPFYSYFEADALTWSTWAWPLIHKRRETGPDFERASFYVLPFYRGFQTVRDAPDPTGRGENEDYAHLWPLFESEQIDDWRRDAILALWPMTRSDLMRHYWGWLWELYAVERQGEVINHRAWLGLYRYATDGEEERHSVPFLWSQRSWGDGEERVVERSLLLGLIRWRSGPGSRDSGMMRPALPGPGWPKEWSQAGDSTGPPDVP